MVPRDKDKTCSLRSDATFTTAKVYKSCLSHGQEAQRNVKREIYKEERRNRERNNIESLQQRTGPIKWYGQCSHLRYPVKKG